MKVALVHDYLNQYGGAERVLESLCRIFPDAPIYTLLYDRKGTGCAFEGRKIHTSFMQNIPLVKKRHRLFLMLMPLAIEQFDLSPYDLVISDSTSYAKGVITTPNARHICYCHTPLRYAWDDCHKYIRDFNFPNWLKKFVPFPMSYVRFWDEQASVRVDEFLCNSACVASRIKKYYRREAKIVYPPVGVNSFYCSGRPGKYFLLVGRLITDKYFDFVIQAFNELGWPLKIVGDGPDRRRLEKMAGRNIEFVGLVPERALRQYYADCRAFIFPQEADFGIAGVEAMAAGRPVIAYRAGGAEEIVEQGVSGLFFDRQTPEYLTAVLRKFNPDDFDAQAIRARAMKFDEGKFREKIEQIVYAYRH